MNATSPSAALAWELWTRHRPVWLLMAWVWAGSVALWPLAGGSVRELVMIVSTLSGMLTLAALYWIFSFAEPDDRGRHGGFPSRWLRLPLATWRLAAGPIVGGVGAVWLFCLVWPIPLAASLGERIDWAGMMTLALTLAAAMTWLQAIVWLLYGYPWIRMGALLAVLIGLIGSAVGASEFNHYGLGAAGFRVALGVCAAAGAGVAALAVGWDRRGTLQSRVRLFRGISPIVSTTRPFRSGAAALFWFEWRRKGALFGALLGLVLATPIMVLPLPMALQLEPSAMWLHLAVLPWLLILMAYCAGLSLAKTGTNSEPYGVTTMTALRPVTTWALAAAKLQGALAVTVLGWVVFVMLAPPFYHTYRLFGADPGVWPAWSEFYERHGELVRWTIHPLTVAAALGITFRWLAVALSEGSSGRTGFVVKRGMLQMGGHGVLVCVLIWGVMNARVGSVLLGLLPWFTAAAIAVKAFALARSAREAQRRGLWASRTSWAMCGLAAGLTAILFGAAFTFDQISGLPGSIGYAAAAYGMPAGEFAAIVTRLHDARHR